MLSDDRAYGHCELSGDMACPQPLSKAAARCELCTGHLDPKHHPKPSGDPCPCGDRCRGLNVCKMLI